MGYVVRTKRSRWYVQLETYPLGKRTAKTVKGPQLAKLGIRPDMSMEHVKLVVKDLNKREHEIRWDEKRQNIAKRLDSETVTEIKHLPQHLVEEFENELKSFPGYKKVLSNWRAAKRLILELKIPPAEWGRRKQAIYNYFEVHRLSEAYAKKIIRLLNSWGQFFAFKTNTTYVTFNTPTGHARGRISKAYKQARTEDKASGGMTIELLSELKKTMQPEQYNWMFVSFWFGLRPQEMKNLKKPDFTYFSRESDVDILNIRQTKLSNLSEDEQWKMIPILYPEQRIAAEIIKQMALKIPLCKTIRSHTKGNYKLYAGRKGFGPLMWDKGHDIVEVSSYLGHKSIDRTYHDYMRWKKLKLRKVG